MILKETIKKILREELYSPAGEEYIPGILVAHKSNPIWRTKIKKRGLKIKVGDCYRLQVGDKYNCKKAIFATDSTDEKYMFDSTYDDDIWLINTSCAGVTWYIDKHFDSNNHIHHIVTFENISPECIKLIHEGTGKSY